MNRRRSAGLTVEQLRHIHSMRKVAHFGDAAERLRVHEFIVALLQKHARVRFQRIEAP